MSAGEVRLEVVFATPERQELVELAVPEGTTVAEAIDASGIADRFPAESLDECPVGIWGREVSRDQVPREGDRIEIYRPLAMDPKEARRQQALTGRTMVDRRSGTVEN